MEEHTLQRISTEEPPPHDVMEQSNQELEDAMALERKKVTQHCLYSDGTADCLLLRLQAKGKQAKRCLLISSVVILLVVAVRALMVRRLLCRPYNSLWHRLSECLAAVDVAGEQGRAGATCGIRARDVAGQAQGGQAGSRCAAAEAYPPACKTCGAEAGNAEAGAEAGSAEACGAEGGIQGRQRPVKGARGQGTRGRRRSRRPRGQGCHASDAKGQVSSRVEARAWHRLFVGS